MGNTVTINFRELGPFFMTLQFFLLILFYQESCQKNEPFLVFLELHLSSGASQVVPVVKNLPVNAGDEREADWIPELGRSPKGGKWQLIPEFLPGKFPRQEQPGGRQSMGSHD